MTRRRGQALLLAVLLMVFAALLGATFITIVAGNLNQTQRQGGLASARSAAGSALIAINDKLTNSVEGERWRPWLSSPPPLPTDTAQFNRYYTSFERAQGWVNNVSFVPANGDDRNNNGITYQNENAAGQQDEIQLWVDEQLRTVPGAVCFVKVPDPRGLPAQVNSPQYLAQIKPLSTGQLQIDVIGQDEDDPAVFVRRIAYKATHSKGGPFSFARFDTHYNFARGALSQSKVRTVSATLNTLLLQDVGNLEAGRTVMIGTNPTTVQVGTVSAVDKAANSITLRDPLPLAAAVGTEVRSISPLMDGLLPSAFDADGDNTFGNLAYENTLPPLRPSTRGIMINNGAVLEGKSTLILGGSSTATPDDDDTLSVAGLIVPRPATPVDQALLRSTDATPVEVALPDSNDPRNTPLAALVKDNRVGDDRPDVQSVTPPRIDGQDSRYIQLTQLADSQNGSTFGYGPGVYIDNDGDIERETVGGQLVTSSLSKSQRLYARKVSTFATPAPAAPNGSLEERHVRGWVSPWEFRPRGVLIEFKGNNIVFTRDDRSDGTAALYASSDPRKAWRAPNGGAIANPGPNTYRMVLEVSTGRRFFGAPGLEVEMPATNTPFNGVIYTGGNARVRGYLTSGTSVSRRDITLVSQGSIFIEGQLVRHADYPDGAYPTTIAAPPRIALLAKRNVVLNPTQFVPPVDGSQDRDIVGALVNANAAVGAVDLGVDNVQFLRVGDMIRVGGGAGYYRVQAINVATGAGTVTLSRGLDAPAVAGAVVRPLSDAPIATEGGDTFYRMETTVGPTPTPGAVATPLPPQELERAVMARDLKRDGVLAPAGLSVSWPHGAQRVTAFAFKRKPIPTPLDPAPPATDGTFSIKKKLSATDPTLILGATVGNEKLITVTAAANTFDLLDSNANTVRDGDTIETLAQLANSFAPPQTGWEMDFALGPPNAATYAARRLAAVGWRFGGANETVTGASDTDDNVAFKVPLAISAGLYFQPAWDSALGSLVPVTVAPAVPTPLVVLGASELPEGDDDVETTRDDFYQRPGSATTATPVQARLRWRTTPLAAPPDRNSLNPLAFRYTQSQLPENAPEYRLGVPKLERDPFDITSGAFDTVPFAVQATIFAQNGSWCVVVPQPNDFIDMNYDGDNTDPEDRAAATRFRRTNYQITVTGTLVQNFAPTAMFDYDHTTAVPSLGLMRTWIDASSHPSQVADDGAGNGRGTNWQSIEYRADPLPPITGLYLPPSPDLIYTD